MAHYSTVRNTNASTLLASMLESIKSEIGETSRVFVSINSEDAALLLWPAVRDYYMVLQDEFLVKCLKCLNFGIQGFRDSEIKKNRFPKILAKFRILILQFFYSQIFNLQSAIP